MVLIGVVLAATYWAIDSFVQIFMTQNNFFRPILGVDVYDIFTRIIVLCLFLIFGSHVQFNINKRKKAEKDLLESEEKYRNILESIEEGYYEVDLKGNLSFFNDSICEISGYSKDELKGRNSREFMNEKDAQQIFEIFNRVYETGTSEKSFYCHLINKNGSKRAIEASVSLIRNPASNIKGFRGIARDVTETRRLEKDLLDTYRNLQEARSATILGLAKLAEYRDKATGSHLERIREYSKLLAIELSVKSQYKDYITQEYIDSIYQSSILHDIGKVGIPDSILLKEDRLTEDEFEQIKYHTTLGGNALSMIESKIEGQSFLSIGKEIAFFHHEKWDGTGYPQGRHGDDTPLSARIVALADVYDALTSARPYKKAFTHEKTVAMITSDKGTHFDPDVVDAFLAKQKDFNTIREIMLDTHYSIGESVQDVE